MTNRVCRYTNQLILAHTVINISFQFARHHFAISTHMFKRRGEISSHVANYVGVPRYLATEKFLS